MAKEADKIYAAIEGFLEGEPFTVAALVSIGSYQNVRKILSRMVMSKKLIRPARGIYVRPKEIPHLGNVSATVEKVIMALAKQTGEMITIHGAEATRQLRLSTQVPVKPIYNTSGATREIKIGKQTVLLKHVCPRKQVMPDTMVCTVMTALWYLGKNHVNSLVIKKLKQQLTDRQYTELLNHTNHMPHWMRESFKLK